MDMSQESIGEDWYGNASIEQLIHVLTNFDRDAGFSRFRIIRELGIRGDSQAVEPLTHIAATETSSSRADAIEALRDLGSVAIATLSNSLSDEDYRVCLQAADILREIGVSEALFFGTKAFRTSDEALDQLLHGPSLSVGGTVAIIDSVSVDEFDEFVNRLIKLASHPDYGEDNMQYQIAFVLGCIGAPAINPLIDTLSKPPHNDKEIATRITLAKALALTRHPDALHDLIALLADVDLHIRGHAAEGLGMIGDTRAVKPLIKALSDENIWVRGMAASALGKIADPAAVAALIQALAENGKRVRWLAANALRAIGTPEALQALEAAGY